MLELSSVYQNSPSSFNEGVSLKIYLNDNTVYLSKTKVGHTLLQCHPPGDFEMYMPKAI